MGEVLRQISDMPAREHQKRDALAGGGARLQRFNTTLPRGRQRLCRRYGIHGLHLCIGHVVRVVEQWMPIDAIQSRRFGIERAVVQGTECVDHGHSADMQTPVHHTDLHVSRGESYGYSNARPARVA